MELISLMLAITGFVGWAWIWTHSKYKTTCTWQTQIAMIGFGLMWLSLILADTVQHLEPTSGTIFARLIILVSCGLMTPKLKDGDSDENI